MNNLQFLEYLTKNNGELIEQKINYLKLQFPAGIMEFKYVNNNWEIILPHNLGNLRKIDIEFMQKAIYHLEQMQIKEDI